MRPEELLASGLGLPQGVVGLSIAQPGWGALATRLADELRLVLAPHVAAVEHIGSTAVPGLLCKPIIDLAVLLGDSVDPALVIELLTGEGWHFVGDQGSAGGLVFSVRDDTDQRLVHLHVIGAGDPQWNDYLIVRDRLRSDPDARAEYVAVKATLAAAHPFDRVAYTDGKDDIVLQLRTREPSAFGAAPEATAPSSDDWRRG